MPDVGGGDTKEKVFDGSREYPVADFLRMTEGASLSGVYAISDGKETCRFVGSSKNLHASVRAQQRRHEEECIWVRALVRPAAGMDQLQIIASSWVEDVEEEEGYCPAGNVHDDSSWAMVEKQLASTDTGLGPQGRGGEEAAVDRELSRRNLDKAVEDNDVGDESSTIVSPFAGNAGAVGLNSNQESLPLDVPTVDKILDEVRPYLIADGGNCRVVAVDDSTGDVSLQLEGACGTCPSSTVTLKMGIERALRERYGSRLGQVVQVTGEDDDEVLSIKLCNKLLAPVKPAVEGLGGSMEVLEVDAGEGRVRIKYSGPQKLTYGIELTLKDNSQVKKIEFVS